MNDGQPGGEPPDKHRHQQKQITPGTSVSATAGIELFKGLPSNVDAERFILGSILLDDARFISVAAALEVDDFTTEAHRRIYRRMCEISVRSEKIDRVTISHELRRWSELESVGGLSYVISLDDGLPHIANLDSYVAIVKRMALLRRLAIQSQITMNRALMAEDDPALVISDATKGLLAISNDDNRVGPLQSREVIAAYPGGLNALLDPSTHQKGLSTGFTKFDEMTGGLRPGELIILAARPSMGKTALACNIVEHVVLRLLRPAVVFSLEMSAQSLIQRMICANARVDSQRFRAGYTNEREREKLRAAAGRFYDVSTPLFIDDTASITVMEIYSRCQRLVALMGPLGLVVIDYLQLLTGTGLSENRNQEVSLITRMLKIMSKDLGAPVLALSQLSRATETRVGDHRPQLSDLRESGSIEQDADIVGFIFREEVYKRDREDLRGVAELILAKQRNGPIGKIELVFLHALTKFENRAEDLGDGPTGPMPDQDGLHLV